jgi:hypothetical protein
MFDSGEGGGRGLLVVIAGCQWVCDGALWSQVY